ncbi:hypothetical protein X975_17572, partial [Stegodyphus mimosarum]
MLVCMQVGTAVLLNGDMIGQIECVGINDVKEMADATTLIKLQHPDL